MPNYSNDPIVSASNSPNAAAVLGEGSQFEGLRGVSHNAHGAVVGINDFAPAAPPGAGGNGGWFESTQGEGVRGWAKTAHHGGVVGVNTAGGFGVYGKSDGTGVVGESKNLQGVYGTSSLSAGVHGRGPTGGFFEGGSKAGVHAVNLGNGPAGLFQGDVEVSGDIRLANADCAEDFNIGLGVAAEPGFVMVLGEEGALFPCQIAYDKRVVGVVSGAGIYRAAIILDKQPEESQGLNVKRQPIALLGKVYCWVDTQNGAIETGDLLTTSSTPGHGMRATDLHRAFGCVIGKALGPLHEGQGLVPILIALQ